MRLLMLAGQMILRLLRSFFLLILRRLNSEMPPLTDFILSSDDPDTWWRKCVQLPWSVSLLLLVSPMLLSLLQGDLIRGATRGFFFCLHIFYWTLSILFVTFSDFSDPMSAADKIFSLRHASDKLSFFIETNRKTISHSEFSVILRNW